MSCSRYTINGQLRLGDAEISSFTREEILGKIRSARDEAGLNRLLLLPSHNRRLNDVVLAECRRLGLEVYLWYKVLADNDIIPETPDLTENAWGWRGLGRSGVWLPIEEGDESYLFACARNAKYNRLVLARCEQLLDAYDGLFVDCIGFPAPSMGLEAVFSCFCPWCLENEPRLREWRERVRAAKEAMVSASGEELAKWLSFRDTGVFFGTEGYYDYRYSSVTHLVRQYAALARRQGKGIGLDVLSPAIAIMSGHDYAELGKVVDWLKPRLYSRVYGPSSLPLELYCLALGMDAWCKRLTLPVILGYIGRATGITLPESVLALQHGHFPETFLFGEAEKAKAMASCPVYPGLEFSLHPEHDTRLDAESVSRRLEVAAEMPGVTLAWNLLFVPDEYLRVVGRHLA